MSELINKAREIIQMSLESDADKDEYSLKASDWLKRFEALQKEHTHDSETSCSICGFDLACPNCTNE